MGHRLKARLPLDFVKFPLRAAFLKFSRERRVPPLQGAKGPAVCVRAGNLGGTAEAFCLRPNLAGTKAFYFAMKTGGFGYA